MDSNCGQTIGKDYEFEYLCKSEKWIKLEIDDRVEVYCKIPNENYIIKLGLIDGIDDEI